MPYVLRYAARSDVGRVRAKNDDSAYVGRHLAVLADGMGGHVGGDVASASTVLDLAPLDATGYEDPATVLPDEIQNANLILNELVHANPKLAGMGTTCTAALLAGETLHMAHIGDSRAYRLKDGEFEQITRDHTFVQRLVDEGRLAPEEAGRHPNKNVLMRVLGDVDASPELDVFDVPVSVGERWLFCSDGLTDVVPVPTIHATLADAESLDEALDDLLRMTLDGGAPDNVTVLAFEIVEASPEELEANPEVPLTEQALAAAKSEGPGAVSGRLLREDLDSRPHVVVGAADNAVHTDRLPIVTKATTKRRAAVLLGEEPTPQNRPLRTAAILTSGGPVPDDPAARTPGDLPKAAAAAEATRSLHDDADDAGTGADSTDTTSPSGSSAGAHVAEDHIDDGYDEDYTEQRLRPRPYRRGVFIPLFTALLALLLGAVLVWGYLWTQTQHYVGVHEGRVAVFKGVPQQLGPISLSHVDRRTDIELDSLNGYTRSRVESGVPAESLEQADRIIENLERDGRRAEDDKDKDGTSTDEKDRKKDSSTRSDRSSSSSSSSSSAESSPSSESSSDSSSGSSSPAEGGE
ncbi:PP2C family serine/threonine-protein phosphatase [Micrococcus cohnii]|uniref:Protein phosphatase n=1 Tax=Micrococcus cohnii TaxID=993416 RepID=A0A7W7M438_9MICC|nr:protein phosphatase 2C domain-containing protein [Micrococcus cohnii]MBB4736290.1 protein phosphatase [Micrococcus cohnii]